MKRTILTASSVVLFALILGAAPIHPQQAGGMRPGGIVQGGPMMQGGPSFRGGMIGMMS
jgi:hypothetical protein